MLNKYCQCGCGQELTGRRTRWANDECRAKHGRSDDAKLAAKETSRARMLKHRYGITEEDFDKILEFQGGGCAVCGRTNNKRRYHHVDHDHKTMIVRGVLCFRCNVHLLGKLTLAEVEAAVVYLRDPPAPKVVGQIYALPEANRRRKRKRFPRKRP